MRLQLILPRLEPTVITLPATCPYGDCQGAQVRLRALRGSKVVYIAVSRLRKAHPFVELGLARLRCRCGLMS